MKTSIKPTRRHVIAGLAATSISAPAFIKNARAADSIVFVGYGGSTQKMYDEHVLQPIAKKLGIQLINAYGPDLAKLKAQVQANKVEWDLISTTGAQAMAAGKEGLLEPIDYSIVKNAELLSVPKNQFTMPWYIYWAGIAYDPKRHPDGKHPKTWAEFWDVKKIPGRRGLPQRAEETFDLALLADGVAPKSVYPMDVERAFRSLDKIKPNVAHWFTQTQQSISLIQTGEADFTYTFKGRVMAAQAGGVSMELADENPIVSITHLVSPRGTKHREVVMRFLNELLTPEMQATFVNNLPGNGPATGNAKSLIKPEIAKVIPDPKAANVVITDDQWWADNYDKVVPRFKEWLLKG